MASVEFFFWPLPRVTEPPACPAAPKLAVLSRDIAGMRKLPAHIPLQEKRSRGSTRRAVPGALGAA